MNIKNKKKSIRIIVTTTISVVIGVVIYYSYFLYVVFRDPYDDATFNHGTWLTAAECRDIHNPRGPMVKDLMLHHLHKGISKKDTHNLLGNPDTSYLDRDMYFLGNWGYLSIDGDYLVIIYDRNDRLVSTKLEPG